MTPAVDVTYCAHCGLPVDASDHARCARHLELEPPRHCPACARRMKVQVSPTSWTAECVEHGVTESVTASVTALA